MCSKPALLTAFLLPLICLPAWAQDSTQLIDSGLKPVLVKRPAFPFQSATAKAATKEASTLRLKLRSQSANEITDEAEWFDRNVLPRPLPRLEEDYRYVPAETRWGELKFFRSSPSGEHIGIYALARKLEKPVDNVYDESFTFTALLFDKDYSPRALFILDDFFPPILEMSQVALVDHLLYFDCNFNGYASIMKEKTGYLVALDLDKGDVVWSSAALTSSFRGFLVHGDVIFAGYGFTDEPDFLFVIDRKSGKVLQKEKLKSAHDVLVVKKDRLFVRCYDTDYEFDVVEKGPRK
jgi:hypothetical protein